MPDLDDSLTRKDRRFRLSPGREESQLGGEASRLRCKERAVVALRSLHPRSPTPPPAEEGEQAQARGEEGEGRGFGDFCEIQLVNAYAIIPSGVLYRKCGEMNVGGKSEE